MLPWLEAMHDVGSSSWPVMGLLADPRLAIALCKQPGRLYIAQVDCWPHQGFSAKGLRLHPVRPGTTRMYHQMPRPQVGRSINTTSAQQAIKRHRRRQLHMQRLKLAAPIAALPALCSRSSHVSVLPGRWTPTSGSFCRRQLRTRSSRSSRSPLSYASRTLCFAPAPL